jgi:hypothetical protein
MDKMDRPPEQMSGVSAFCPSLGKGWTKIITMGSRTC